jgi:hypothetical protein
VGMFRELLVGEKQYSCHCGLAFEQSTESWGYELIQQVGVTGFSHRYQERALFYGD